MRRSLVLAVIAAAALAGMGRAQERGAQPPPGDYFRTCRNISTYGYGPGATMAAECRDDYGRWRSTSLRFTGCERVETSNGDLVCRRGDGEDGNRAHPPGPPPWAGGDDRPGYGRRSQITLFSQPNFGGERFQAREEITNLPRRFNDQALSLRIEGRGAWQVCADSDFRGRCQVIDRDVADLRAAGLGYAISSMRPYRDR